jgi:hypothetical protein
VKKDAQLAILFALGALGAWLWFSRAGQAVAKTAGETVSAGVSIVEKLVRGERNNNPGNIRISANAWKGKIPVTQNTDKSFEQFDTVQNGIRALGKLLIGYAKNYGLNTIRGIISRYAPPTENVTDAYVKAVANEMNITPDSKITLTNPTTLFFLVKAIIRHENGRVYYNDATIQDGVSRALT